MNDIFRRMGPVTKNLLIINIIIWAFCAFMPASTSSRMLDYCGLHYFTSPGFGAWQLVTYMFVHVDFWHLFFNMFALVMFGSIIEMAMGRKRYLVYYLSCGIGAALIQEGVFAIMLTKYSPMLNAEQMRVVIDEGWHALQQGMNFTDPTLGSINALVNGPVIGASGAIFGILLAFAMLYPNMPVYIWFVPIPVKAKWMVAGYAVLELAMGLGSVQDNVAHFAHLGGMVIGFALLWYWKKSGAFRGFY